MFRNGEENTQKTVLEKVSPPTFSTPFHTGPVDLLTIKKNIENRPSEQIHQGDQISLDIPAWHASAQ